MRNTTFCLDERISKERSLTLYPIITFGRRDNHCQYRKGYRGGKNRLIRNYSRDNVEAWLICKVDVDHTTNNVTHEMGIEFVSKGKGFRLVRPISTGKWLDLLYYWKNRMPLTSFEKREVDRFVATTLETCQDIDNKMQLGRVKRAKFAIEHISKRMGDFIDNEVFALGETTKGGIENAPVQENRRGKKGMD